MRGRLALGLLHLLLSPSRIVFSSGRNSMQPGETGSVQIYWMFGQPA